MKLGIDTIDLYLTGKCNLKCGYCYGEDDSKPHMSKETIDACLKFAEESGITTVELCGGEPLLSPYFEYSVLESKKRGMDIILRTNGVLLEDYYDLIAESCKWVGISIDGLHSINALMRPSACNMTSEVQFLKPLNSIYELKKRNPSLNILLASVASKVNYLDLEKFKDYLIEHKVPIDKWKIYQFITDKFRSVENAKAYNLSRSEFDVVIQGIPEQLPNGAVVIHQRSDYEGAGGNCLLVHQDGLIKILGKKYGVIGKDSNDSIRSNLMNESVLSAIKDNKGKTYDGKTSA